MAEAAFTAAIKPEQPGPPGVFYAAAVALIVWYG